MGRRGSGSDYTVQAAVFDVAHLRGVATREHLGHQAIVIPGLVARMGTLKRLPVVGKDLLEDVPVPRGRCKHTHAAVNNRPTGYLQNGSMTGPNR